MAAGHAMLRREKSIKIRASGAARAASSGAIRLLQGSAPPAAGVWYHVEIDGLPMVTDRGWRVPALLAEIRKNLASQDALKREGIFRCSPDHQAYTHIRGRLEAGEDIGLLAGCSPDVLSGLLKEWFRELPGGWLRQKEARGWKPGKHAKGSNSGVSIEELEAAIISAQRVPTSMLKQALRPAQREAMLWLLDLLVEAASFEAHSRMGVTAIAIIFAPVLFPPSASRPPAEQLQMLRSGTTLCERLIVFHRDSAQPPLLRRSSSSKRKLLELSSASTGSTLFGEERTPRPPKQLMDLERDYRAARSHGGEPARAPSSLRDHSAWPCAWQLSRTRSDGRMVR